MAKRSINEPKKKLRVRRKGTSNKFTMAEILSDSVEEIDNRYGMLVYSHPTNLSPEQILFSLELMANGYDILKAIHAVFGVIAEQMSDNDCRALGRRLLKLKKVKAYINEELQNRAEKLQTTADWIATRYRDWADLDVTDYIELKTTDKGRPQIVLKHNTLEGMPKEARSAIKKLKVSPQGDVIVEFVDQKGALDSLAKLQGFMDNKLQVETKAPVIMTFDAQDADA